VPRAVHDRLAKVEATVDALTDELGRPPSIGEVAEDLDLDRDAVLETLAAGLNRKAVSLDAPAPKLDDGAPRVESLAAEERGYGMVEDRVAIAAMTARLDEREREVLRMRFVEELTQRQIAARLGTSQMSVSRLLRRSLANLREAAA